MGPPACWRQALEETIFAPLGLRMDALYVWDEANKRDLLSRNSSLEARNCPCMLPRSHTFTARTPALFPLEQARAETLPPPPPRPHNHSPSQSVAVHTVRPGAPFPIIAVALVGPRHLVPHLPLGSRSYTLLEGTPLYFGIASKQMDCWCARGGAGGKRPFFP